MRVFLPLISPTSPPAVHNHPNHLEFRPHTEAFGVFVLSQSLLLKRLHNCLASSLHNSKSDSDKTEGLCVLMYGLQCVCVYEGEKGRKREKVGLKHSQGGLNSHLSYSTCLLFFLSIHVSGSTCFH